MSREPESDGELTKDERALAERLHAARPLPTPGFRGALGRHLVQHDPGYGPRPEELGMKAARLAGAGALLLAVGALQATGVL